MVAGSLKDNKGVATENWQKQSDSAYTVSNFYVQDNDTLFSEMIKLEQKGGELYYIPTVKEQNEGAPVQFKLSSISDQQMVFDNADHYSPQKISLHQSSK